MKGELELAASDGRGVQHLVHDSRHLLGARLNDRRQLALLARLRPCGEQAGGADHRVELIPELMADVGEQLGVDLDRAVVVAVHVRLWRLELVHQQRFSGGG